MLQTWQQGWWRIGLTSLLATGSMLLFFDRNPAWAQIIPDNTLGNERSRVTPNVEVQSNLADRIDGGAVRGANLFHSFQEFNVGDGQRVYFSNPSGVENILSRVTGRDVSDIMGTLGVLGNANLFLLNPNGIIFGPHARLDVRGSFLATTADRFNFPDGSEFSAINPQTPPLLTINITPGLQYGTNPGNITNQGQLAVGQNLTLGGNTLNLQGQLAAGNNLRLEALDTLRIRDSAAIPFIAASGGLMLLQGNQANDIFALNHPNSGLFSGGDMVLRSSQPISSDAHFWSGGNFRIEQLNGQLGNFVSLDDPIIRVNGNVAFDSYTGASLHVFASGSVNAGSITINGTDFSDPIHETVPLSKGTSSVEISSDRPTIDIRAGTSAVGNPVGVTGNPSPVRLIFSSNPSPTADIRVDRIRVPQPDGLVFLTNQYQPNAAANGVIQIGSIRTDDNSGRLFAGDSGDVWMDSRGDIILNAFGRINTSSQTGNAGNISLLANNAIFLAGGAAIRGGTDGVGRGGDIYTRSSSLSLTDGASISTNTLGQGHGGNLLINAAESVQLTGTSALQAATRGAGDAGHLSISTGRLVLRDGSQVLTSTFGERSAGNLTVVASEAVDLSGVAEDRSQASGLYAITRSAGRAGNISIDTQRLTLQDGAQISTLTFGSGHAGNLLIRASDAVELLRTPDDSNRSERGQTGLYTSSWGDGDGGHLQIETDRLTVAAGAQITSGGLEASTGNAGDLTILARRAMEMTGIDGEFATGVYSGNDGTGNSGDLTIQTGRLVLRHGAVAISANGTQQGQAGDLTVHAFESVELLGTQIDQNGTFSSSGLFSSTTSSEAGGNIRITTPRLTLRNGGQVEAGTTGRGRGGNITVNASALVEIIGIAPNGEFSSWLRTRSDDDGKNRAQGDGGNLTINTRRLILRDGGQLSVSTLADGNAGNLMINASEAVQLSGVGDSNNTVRQPFGSAILAQVVSGASGNGGSIEINTGQLSISDGAEIRSGVSGSAQGNAGRILIHATDSVRLNDNGGDRSSTGIFSNVEEGGIGNGGTIRIRSPVIQLNNGAQVNTSIQGNGRAGSINLHTDQLHIDNNARIASTTASGSGGNIEVTANTVYATTGGRILTTTSGRSNAGSIDLHVQDGLTLTGHRSGLFASTTSTSTGNGGDITIDPAQVLLQDGAQIAVNSRGSGEGGNIQLRAGQLTLDRGVISAETTSNQGGNLDLTVEDELLLRDRSRISATAGTAQGNGDGGNITVQSPFVIAIPAENSDITANAFQGNGGSIQITTQGIFGIESRDGRTPLSDITASSEFGLSGVVDINTPNVDPARGLVELPATPVDVAGLINQNFCRRGQESQFIITGQGGLPSSPNETLNPEMPWDDLRLVPEGESSPPIPVPSNNDSLQSNKTNSSEAIVEAQGWIVAPDGKIMLTSAPVTVTPQGVWLYPIDCQRLQNQS